MKKHPIYGIDDSNIIKDKGLQSFEILMSDRTVKVNRCYVMQDPLDEDLQVKRDWSTIINYGGRKYLKFHFKQEDIDKIYSSIWNDEFITEFEAKQKLAEVEKQEKIKAEEKSIADHEAFLDIQKTIVLKSKKEPKIYEKNSLKDKFRSTVDESSYQELKEETENENKENQNTEGVVTEKS